MLDMVSFVIEVDYMIFVYKFFFFGVFRILIVFLFVILEAVLFIPLYFLTVYCLELLFSCFAYADLGRPQIA